MKIVHKLGLTMFSTVFAFGMMMVNVAPVSAAEVTVTTTTAPVVNHHHAIANFDIMGGCLHEVSLWTTVPAGEWVAYNQMQILDLTAGRDITGTFFMNDQRAYYDAVTEKRIIKVMFSEPRESAYCASTDSVHTIVVYTKQAGVDAYTNYGKEIVIAHDVDEQNLMVNMEYVAAESRIMESVAWYYKAIQRSIENQDSYLGLVRGLNVAQKNMNELVTKHAQFLKKIHNTPVGNDQA